MTHLTLNHLANRPDLLAGAVQSSDSVSFAVRLLGRTEAHALGRFFAALSAAVREVYGPHPLSAAHAEVMCANLDFSSFLPFLAWTDDDEIAAYVAVRAGVHDSERQRYAEHGQPLEEDQCATIAPCVSDCWQNHGIGSAVLSHVAGSMRRIGRKRLVLWGGVRGDNPRAQHVYEKQGFRCVGRFADGGVDNLDMVCDL